MYAIFKKTLYDFRWTLFWYLTIVTGYTGMVVSFYPTIRENAGEFVKLMESYPKGFMEAFGIRAESMSTLSGFLSMEYFSLFFIIILAVLVFNLGASLIAGEVDRGVSEFTFTLPLKRGAILAGKLIASYAVILSVIAATIILTYIAGLLVDETMSIRGLGALFAILAVLGFFLLSLTTLLSSMFRGKGLVYGVAGGFLGLSYIAHILNGLSEKASGAYVFSFFKYYGSPEQILLSGHLELSSFLTLLLVGIGLLSISFLVTEDRDL